MQPELKPAVDALKAGDKARAFNILRKTLKSHPSANGWILAAQVMPTEDQRIACVKKALELDPWHNQANRMLLKLEATESIVYRQRPGDVAIEKKHNNELKKPQIQIGVDPLPEIKRNVREMAYQRHERKRKSRRRFGCLMMILLHVSFSFLSLSLLGVFPGTIGTVHRALGGDPPIREVEGVPIREITHYPAATVPPSLSKPIEELSFGVMDHGYNHEYTFQVRSGQRFYGYVQFISLTADRIEENSLILDSKNNITNNKQCWLLEKSLEELLGPEDIRSVEALPESQELSEILGQGLFGPRGLFRKGSNAIFVCLPSETGTWKLRILGIKGESIGSYLIAVRRF